MQTEAVLNVLCSLALTLTVLFFVWKFGSDDMRPRT